MPMKHNLQFATLVLAAGFFSASPAAVAQDTRLYNSGNQWVQEVSGAFPAGKIVKVKSSNGSIHIQGAQQKNITYTIREHVLAMTENRARHELSHMKFTTYTTGDTVVWQAECEGSKQSSIDFDIQVPVQTSLVRLETDGGLVTANGLA